MNISSVQPLGAVVIGRNEGARLGGCLRSLRSADMRVVYVDSGSTDTSRELARASGADVIELDMNRPFSMARARNAGFQRLREVMPDVALVQFVDGDCELVEGWLATATEYLSMHSGVVAVCGRRREKNPGTSRYNRLCDIEWNTPIGPARSCGGDVLMRAAAFAAVGGFHEGLIAGEEPELCRRLRAAGGEIHRLAAEMTRHDAAILSFEQWWKRTVRGGYGAMDVVSRLRAEGLPPAEIPFWHLTTSAHSWTGRWLFAAALCVAGVGIAAFNLDRSTTWGALAGLLPPLGLWILQALRIAYGIRSRAPNGRQALLYGVFTMLGKWAQRVGQTRYRRDIRQGRIIRIIEYKK